MKDPEDSVFQEAMDGVAPLKEDVRNTTPRPRALQELLSVASCRFPSLAGLCSPRRRPRRPQDSVGEVVFPLEK